MAVKKTIANVQDNGRIIVHMEEEEEGGGGSTSSVCQLLLPASILLPLR